MVLQVARWVCPLLLSGVAGGCWAGESGGEPIQTDRPDFVESSDVVGAGHFQIETSVAVSHDAEDGVKTRERSFPTLLRVGLNDTVELRIETDGPIYQRVHEQATGLTTHAHGMADVALGLKWHMRDGDEERGTPGIGWLLHVDMDSGSGAFRGQGWRPSLRMVAEWALPHGYSVGVMPGLYQERDDEDKAYVGGIFAVVVGKALNDQWRVFGELTGEALTTPRHGGNVVTADAGAAVLLGKDIQLDCAFAKGMSRHAPNQAWTLGLSVRF